jgi:hypothetical protein
MVVAELPPDTDPIGKNIDKIAFREALLALLSVALPVMRVDVLTASGSAVAQLCMTRAGSMSHQSGAAAALKNLRQHAIQLAPVLSMGATIIVIGGGDLTMGLRLTSLVSNGVIPVGSTGGAALAIWEEAFGASPMGQKGGMARLSADSYAAAMRDDPVYDALFRDLLRRAYPETMAEKAAAPAVTDAR